MRRPARTSAIVEAFESETLTVLSKSNRNRVKLKVDQVVFVWDCDWKAGQMRGEISPSGHTDTNGANLPVVADFTLLCCHNVPDISGRGYTYLQLSTGHLGHKAAMNKGGGWRTEVANQIRNLLRGETRSPRVHTLA